MNERIEDNRIDGFLFIDNLQTTVRQLRIFSAIIIQLNNKQLPKKILEKLLTNWSVLEEGSNIIYKNSKGKITNNSIKTSAIGYYLQISSSLGLTTRFNDVYMNTKMSQTFLYFLKNIENKNDNELSLAEKAFYLFKLFTKDADGVILCLSQLLSSKEKKQQTLQVEFKEAINRRLVSKMEEAPSIIKRQISAKYRTINFVWKSPGKYAEHIIAPRYEWLCALGLVNIRRDKKDTLYSLNDQGLKLYNLLPTIGKDDIKDINQNWLYKYYFDVLNEIYNVENRENYLNLTMERQIMELGESLEMAIKVVKSSMSFKLPIIEAYIFICLDFLLNKNIIINFCDIENKISHNFLYNSRIYLLKSSGRLNEGYITITLKK